MTKLIGTTMLTIALGAAGCALDVGSANEPADEVTQADLEFYDQSPADIGDPQAIVTTDLSADAIAAIGTRGARAIQWFEAHRGSTAYEGLCELAVELSFGTRGRYPSAIDNWHAQVRAGRAHPGDRTPPGGAMVFWNTSSFGHVAVADGVGGEWSTSVNGRIGHARLSYFNNYLGWAWAPTSWPGR